MQNLSELLKQSTESREHIVKPTVPFPKPRCSRNKSRYTDDREAGRRVAAEQSLGLDVGGLRRNERHLQAIMIWLPLFPPTNFGVCLKIKKCGVGYRLHVDGVNGGGSPSTK